MRFAAIQADIAWESPTENFRRLRPLIASAAASATRVVVLSEMFATGFSMNIEAVSEPSDGPTIEFLQQQATLHNIWIGGSFACRDNPAELPTNRFALVAPDATTHHYDKIHPFSFANEHLAYRPGATFTTVTIDGLRCSLFVCYDLRFADEFWQRANETDVFLIPANWPDSRAHHWKSLLVARAIENQAYVVGCNRIGEAHALRYQGDSMIIDPLGQVLAAASHSESILLADLDAEAVTKTRQRFPFLADRRTQTSPQTPTLYV